MRSLANIVRAGAGSILDFQKENRKRVAFIIALLFLVCLYDLFSPPVSPTIWRQAQTAMLTDNFLREGFSLKGLYVGLNGHDKFMMAFEFPIYNFIVGLLFKLFNNDPFWGKLTSFISAIITVVYFHRLVKSISNNSIAFYASLLFILLPVNVVMSTSFQPDALGLMFMILSIYLLDMWRKTFEIKLFFAYSICLLLCGWCKFPLLVPYIPLLVLMYCFPKRQFRVPRLTELIVISIFFIIPFLSWYLYRTNLTDPILVGGESGAFLVGDLRRFLSAGFYVRPAIMLTMLVFCGTGIIYFFYGLRKISTTELTLSMGIPFYYIIVPTVADQYYYLYAIAPITAFFMARGVVYTGDYFKRNRIGFLSCVLCTSFALFTMFGITYVLRMDKVILPASEAMRQVSRPEDLIFVVNMHDRGVGVGGNNPSVEYFARRNGWNIRDFNPENIEHIFEQINSKRDKGAKWLFVTWYSKSLEPWYSKFLPEEFSRSLKFDSKAIADELKRRYPVVRTGDNFAILNLAQSEFVD